MTTGPGGGPGTSVASTSVPEGDKQTVEEEFGTGGLRSLADRMSWAVFAELINLGATACIFYVVAKRLGTVEYGYFAAALAIAMIAGPLSTFGSNWVLIRRGVITGDIRSDLSRALTTTTIGTLGVAVVLSVLALAVPSILPSVSRPGFILVLVGQMTAFWILELGVTAAVALANLKLAAIMRIVAASARIGALLVFVFSSGTTFESWAWAFSGGTIAAAMGVHILLARSLGGLPTWNRPPLQEFSTGFPYGLGNTTEGFLSAADKPLLTQYGFKDDAGIYAVGYRIVSLGLVPLLALLKAQYRRFFRQGANGSSAAYEAGKRMSLFAMATTAPVSVVLFLAAPLVASVLGDKWADVELVLRFLALLPVIKGFQFAFGNSLTAAGNQKARMWLTGAAAIGNLGGNVIYIPAGSWRAAATTTLMAEVGLAIGFVVASRIYARRQHV